MHASVEVVTVGNAKQYLEQGAPNRTLSRATVERYARDMKAGKWNNNGQGIIIAHDGRLLDGQHRCAAIVESQTPVSMLVVRGADPASFVTMDSGKARSLGDVLSIQGALHANTLASAARGAFNYVANVKYTYMATRSTLSSFSEKHPHLHEVVEMLCQHTTKLPRTPFAVVLFLANDNQHLEDEVKSFVDGVFSGEGLWKGDARLTLRDWYAAERAKGMVRAETMFAATARAWNAYAAGRELERLKMLSKPTRRSLLIYGFDRSLYADVPDLYEAKMERWQGIRRQSTLKVVRPEVQPAA